MLDSDFWQEYAEKFRALDPSGQYLWASWYSDLADGRAEPPSWTLMGVGDIGHGVEVAFEPLARRAGKKLGKPGNLLDTWLNAVKDHCGGDHSGGGFRKAPDGTMVEHIGGRILFLCLAASELCSEMESRALEFEHSHQTGAKGKAGHKAESKAKASSARKPANPARKTTAKRKRRSSMIESSSAVEKLERHLTKIRDSQGVGLTDFASHADITDRTLRTVRATNKARPDTFRGIAKAMGITFEDLLTE